MIELKRYYVSMHTGVPVLVEASSAYLAETGTRGLVKGSDADKLEAEAQALREEVAKVQHLFDIETAAMQRACEEIAALRARVVVVPDRLNSSDSVGKMLRDLGYAGDVDYTHAREIWNSCLDELARLNGKVVSEGLLRKAKRHLGNWLELNECECEGGLHYCGREQVAKTHRELSSLLDEGKEAVS